jgi:Arc/MetJ-type ribon-helix-helix transcriptional regulator
MITCMRTTLVLDDDLVRQVKQRAARRNLTVSEVVNEALREFLKRPVAAAPPFTMVTYGRAARTARHEPPDFAAVLEDEDKARLR